jgi:hypothetical protein
LQPGLKSSETRAIAKGLASMSDDDVPESILEAMVNMQVEEVEAFSVHEVYDQETKFTYYIVPLHDHALTKGAQFAMQLFHEKDEAERFANEHRGKNRQ